MEGNLAKVGIEHGTFSYNARCHIHYTMATYPVLTISGSRSYPKTVLDKNILFLFPSYYLVAQWYRLIKERQSLRFKSR